MKNQIETLLARLTLVILASVFLLMAHKAFAQDRFLLTLGSSYNDALTKLAKYPQLNPSGADAQTIRMENKYLTAEYIFDEMGLNSLKVTRDYPSYKMAFASMEGYLIWLERAGATVFTLSIEKDTEKYCAMTTDAAYDLTLTKSGKSSNLTIRSWRRAENTEFEMLPMASHQDAQ